MEKYILLAVCFLMMFVGYYSSDLTLLKIKPYSAVFIFVFIYSGCICYSFIKNNLMLYKFIQFFKVFMFVLFSIQIITTYLITITFISGYSMNDTYNDGDAIFVQYIFKPKRFDVVIIDIEHYLPSVRDEYYVKRIIGLSGEHIKYYNNKLYVNNVLVEENISINGETEDFDEYVDDCCYFVLGDNRIGSEDSRYFGSINKKHFIGKVMFSR